MSLRRTSATKQSRQKQSTRLNRFTILTITTTLSLITLILGGLLLLPNTSVKAEQATTEQDTNINLSIAEVVGLSINNCPGLPDSDSSSITLTPSPTINGTFASNCQTITAYANVPGYSLLMKHQNDEPQIVTNETQPVVNPAGYDFTTDDGVRAWANDLYNNGTTSLPTGVSCWINLWPSESLEDAAGWGCDDGSGTGDYCTISDTNGTCVDPDTSETLCYAQAAAPGWCTPNRDGTYTDTFYNSTPNLTYQNPTTIDPKPVIPSTTGTLTTPTTLTNNTWGFAIEQKTGMSSTNFDTTYTANNANNNYAQMPTTDTEIYHTDNLTTGDTFKAFYGTKVNMDTLAGTYSTTITYTVIGEDVPPAPLIYEQISSGYGYACAIASDNDVYCWGKNEYGQLGDGSDIDSDVPIKVNTSGILSGLKFKQISAGGWHTCAIASDDNVYCWGYNGSGQLGDGSNSWNYAPVKVNTSGELEGLTIKQISAGYEHTCVIASNNNAYCWGKNGYGRLGNGSSSDSNIPVKVDTNGVLDSLTVKQVSAGSSHTCVIASDDSAYCWGEGGDGQLGNGFDITSNNTPVEVDASGVLNGLTIKQISAGGSHTCAIASDNNAYCWGDNYNGQLGNGLNGSENNSNFPIEIDSTGALSGKIIKQVSAGDSHTCVVASDNKAYCWGYDGSGQLGNSSVYGSSVPVEVTYSGVINPKQISSGGGHTCVIISNGTTQCWGEWLKMPE